MAEFKCILCNKLGGYSVVKNKTRNSCHQIVRCNSCGLQQLFPTPTVNEDIEYYDKNPHDKEVTPSFDIEDVYRKFEYQNKYRVNYLINDIKIDKNWKILDYGCGYGFLMEMLIDDGYDVEGVEISEDRLKVIKQRQGNLDRVRKFNLLNDEKIPDELIEKYDCVMLFHVIEHITSPVDFLKKVKKLIKKDGFIFMEMPNIDNILMKLSQDFNDYNYFRDHVAYYNPSIMKKLCECAGYSVLKQKGVQTYGLINNMNWMINGKPQLTNPSYEAPKEIKWLEDFFRDKVETDITSEFMYVLAKINNENM